MHKDWSDRINWFSSPACTDLFARLEEEIDQDIDISPDPENIFRVFETPPDDVRVVILGQDPYPTPGHATGLAFSTHPDVSPLPRSLQNIFAELELDCGSVPPNGCLDGWAEQGVFLLNTSLTVRTNDAGSHSKLGWADLIEETIIHLNYNYTNIVFILWGTEARAWSKFISRRKHHVITSYHPSPLSAYRGFFGSRPFSQTNTYLKEHGLEPIDWGRGR